jgi:hypothetical protein
MVEYTEETEKTEAEKGMVFFTPEGIIIMLIAGLIDLIGIFLTIIFLLTLFGVLALEIPAIVDWIVDGIGFVFFGLWLWVRSAIISPGTETESEELTERVVEKRRAMKKAKKKVKAMKAAKTTGRRGLKFIMVFIGEIIPIVGALPFWSWLAYSELKTNE